MLEGRCERDVTATVYTRLAALAASQSGESWWIEQMVFPSETEIQQFGDLPAFFINCWLQDYSYDTFEKY
jgi:hypothetical protein